MTRLTDEDQRLWREVAKTAAPLRLRIDKAAPVAAPAPKPETTSPSPPKAKKAPDVPKKATTLTPKKEPQGSEVDIRTLARLKRGQMAIDGVLDLHGHSLAAAETELAGFIRLKHGQGARCLLIIHGKGMLTGQAKIKKALPDWLAGMSAIVLTYAPALPKHGGQGASYVLLRRKRVTKKT